MVLITFKTQVIWNIKLIDLKPVAEGGSDLGTSCAHWVLDRGLYSESGPCSSYNKTWSKLVQTCIEENIISYTQAYACSTLSLDGYSYLVHGALLQCPHCSGTKVDHLISFLSKVVNSLVLDLTVFQPEEAR